MSNISKTDVEQVAKLARLELTAAVNQEEKEKYSKELGEILDYVNELNEISSAKVESRTEISNIARTDEVTNYNDRENLLSNAPNQEKGFIKVKKVFE